MNTKATVKAKRIIGFGTIGALAATAINAAIYGVGRAADVSFIATVNANGPEHIRLVHVVGFSLQCFAVGLLAAVIAAKLRRPSLRVVQIVGAVIAVGSVTMDAPIDSTTTAKVMLGMMHIVAGIAYIASLEFVRTTRTAAATDVPVATVPLEAALA